MPVLKTAYKYSCGTCLSVISHGIPDAFDFQNHHPQRTNQCCLPTRKAHIHMSEVFRSDLSVDSQREALRKFETQTVF